MTGTDAPLSPDPEGDADSTDYRVLARKYRPDAFAGLIGQDVLVRTFRNAFAHGRLAHAFILTGVRGVGKTTTARIIARALNCIGPDGDGGPTTEPCGKCANCRAISEDRHVDVLEMDAASRTGVDDIRGLIEGVRYRPTTARYKVYIIDEVHMLSKNAFNALLKTLEEPPEHVKFIFATTEIRKVPVTVLSRCQRFDLNRVEVETLARHFTAIAEKEGAGISETAIGLIARAADGSVRDGLSLLDQAISQADGEIDAEQVRGMLGLADRTQTFDLLETVLKGDIAAALDLFERQYRDGADPLSVFEDMLEVVHFLTRIKVVPSVAEARHLPEIERTRGADMAARLGMAVLARTWQMLLKGLSEVRMAPDPKQAAEMVLVRLAYSAGLPTPEEALKALGPDDGTQAAPGPSAHPAPVSSPTGMAVAPAPPSGTAAAPAPIPEPPPPVGEPTAEAVSKPVPQSMEEILALAEERREGLLRAGLYSDMRLVSFEPGRIEFQPLPSAAPDLASRLTKFLNEETAVRWMVTVSNQEGEATFREQREAADARLKEKAMADPLVKAVLDTFPGADVGEVAASGEEDGGEPDGDA